MSIGLFIYQLVTYTIMCDVRIAMALCSLVSLISLSVCVISICTIFANMIHCCLASHEVCDNAEFCKFCCQLLHLSLAKILETLKPGMMTPEVIQFPDGHFRKVIS